MRNLSNRTTALLCALFCDIVWGFSFLFSKLAFQVTTPSVLLAIRFLLAFAFMNLALLLRRKPLSLRGRPWKGLLVLGLTQPVCYFLCESYGINNSTSSFAGTMIALIPMSALALSALLLGERTNLRQKLFTVLSVAGAAVASLAGVGGEVRPLGVILLLGAVLSGGFYNIYSRKTSYSFDAFEQTYFMLGMGAAVFTPLALWLSRNDLSRLVLAPLQNGKLWMSALFLAGLCSVGAFLLLNYALSRVPAPVVAPLGNLTTVVSILAGVIFLHESFTALQAAGSAAIVFGAVGASLAGPKCTLDNISPNE
jgi:Permeases of the drug/metabolite transporter (DMT) superfamily